MDLKDLDRESWFVRWFFWSLGIYDAFLNTDRTWRIEQYGANLCFYVRTMLIWAPFVLILHTIVYGAAIIALTAVPIHYFGGSGYAWIVSAVVLVIGIRLLRNYMIEREESQRSVRRQTRREEIPAVAEAPRGPSFFDILWEWLVAQKKKICPMVTFAKQQE